MKSLQYKLILFLLGILFLAPLVTSCSDSDKSEMDINLVPSDKFDTKIYFISELKDKSIGSSLKDYQPITDFLKEKGKSGSWLALVDRADAEYSRENMVNYGVNTAHEADLYSSLALNKFENNQIEGSMLYFPKYFTDSEGYKVADDCYVKAINLPMKGKNTEINQDISFDVVFRTARFSKPEHISNFTEVVFPKIKAGRVNMLMVGTVKADLFEDLSKGVSVVDNDFTVSKVESSKGEDYVIFVLGFKYMWGLKDSTKLNLSKDINLYELSMMW